MIEAILEGFIYGSIGIITYIGIVSYRERLARKRKNGE